MTQEALKLALEALENGDVPTSENAGKNLDAITAIKEALAEQDVDAIIIQYHEATIKRLEKRIEELLASPPQRTWVGLTDEDMKGMSYGDKVLATWVARTLKEKNT